MDSWKHPGEIVGRIFFVNMSMQDNMDYIG